MAKTVFCQWCAGEPGDHHPECPFGRAERAERELDEARPVLEAAIVWSDPITADVPMEQAKARLMEEVVRYEAARAAEKEAAEPTDQQHLDMGRSNTGGDED